MGQRFVWWWIGIGSVVAGVTLMIGWEFLLKDMVFEWLGMRVHAESLQEKIAYVAMGTTATVLIVAGVLTLAWSRLAAAKELRQSEERFRLVFQESPGLFAMTRVSDGLHYDVNEQWQKVLGYSRQDVVGRTAAEIGIWADVDDRRRLMAALANTPSLRNFEARLKAKNGKTVQVLIAVEKVIVEGDERLLIVAQEITELKKVEDALRASERQLRAIFDNMQDIYFRTDRDGRFVMVSPSFETFIGIPAKEIIGRSILGLYVNPREEFNFRKLLKRNEGRIANYETRLRRGDGRIIWIRANGQYYRDEAGEITGVEGTAHDITDRKNAEDELRKAHGELEVRVQERTQELKEALERVSEVSRAKSDFLANMSHELRTPMNAILGFSDMLAKEALGPMGNPRYRDYAADIYESGQHLLALINELLDLARIEARTLELRDDVVDVGALIRSAIHMCEGLGKESGVTARVAVAVSVPRMRGDELRLSQVFLNLIGNALKFTPTGGRVDVRYGTAADGGIEAVITDTGPGILPEDLERVQTPFARGRQPFVRTKEGLGLGLPLAKAFMEAHGGALDVVSNPGKGTTVTLGFPADRVIRP